MNNLSITSVKGQIGINTINARLDISQPKGEQSLRQIKPKMTIDKEHPKVLIDQSECFSEIGLKSRDEFMREYAELGKQGALEAIARICEDGDRMAQIHKKMPPAIPEIAEKNATPPMREFNIDFIPKSRPKIEVTGSLDINWQLGGIEYSYEPRKPMVTYNPGKVEIYMKKYPELDIKFIDDRK